MKTKKTISSIISVSLLIFVCIVFFLAYNSWFSTFFSSKIGVIDDDLVVEDDGKLNFEGLVDNKLYVFNRISDNNEIKSLKIAGVNCNVSYNLSLGLNVIEVSDCLVLVDDFPALDVFLVTNNRAYSDILLVPDYSDWNFSCNDVDLLLHFDNDIIIGENASKIYDWSGSGIYIEKINGSSPISSGKYSGSYSFIDNLDNSGSVEIDPNLNLVKNIFDGGGSISVWIYPTDWGGSDLGRIIDKSYNIYSGGGYSIKLNNVDIVEGLTFEINFDGNDGTWHTPFNSVKLNQWQHIVVSYNSSSDVNKPVIYVNGVSQILNETSSPSGTRISDSGRHFRIGNYPEGLTFNGKIDEISVWKRELLPGEVKNIYLSNKPIGCSNVITSDLSTVCEDISLLMHFDNSTLDGDTDSLFHDYSGNGYDGFCSGADCPSYSTLVSQAGYGLDFDGDDSYVNTTFNDSLDLITISAWIHPNSYGEVYGRIFDKRSLDGSVEESTAFLLSSTKLVRYARTFDGGSGQWSAPFDSILTGNSYHIVIVHNVTSADNDPLIYINGVSQVVSESTTPSGNPIFVDGPFVFGNRLPDQGRGFDGVIDEVGVWNRLLSSQEVAVLANNQLIC